MEIDYWSLIAKVSLSISLLVAVIPSTVVTLHSTTLNKNKISMLVYYAIVGQALCMCLFYISASLVGFDTMSDENYAIYRDVFRTPICIFSATGLLVLTFYAELKRELLSYQKRIECR